MTATLIPAVASWLLTYLVHSTLLLGGAAILTRYVIRRESLREAVWKAALVGGIVTATVAVALPRPGAPRVELTALSTGSAVAGPAEGPEWAGEAAAAPDPAGGVGDAGSLVAGDAREAGAREAGEVGNAGKAGNAGDAGDAVAVGSRDDRGSAASWNRGGSGAAESGARGRTASGVVAGGVVAWLVIALLLLGRLCYRHVRLRLLLRGREQVPGSAEVASVLTELRRSAGVWMPVRLTSTPAVATPLALGRVEICLPARFLDELGPAEQRAALAHELAHLERRDPIWQVAAAVIGAVFFFQPLNRVARRRIRAAAEYLADGWAVRHTGSQIELARCLASVAGWAAPSAEPALAGTVAMAEGGSPLLDRVQRLLEHEPEEATPVGLRLAVAGMVLAVAAGFGPAVAPASSHGPGPAEAEKGPVDVPAPSKAQDSLDVRRFDGPALEGDGLVARLNAAGRDARGAAYWVAYGIDGSRSEELVTDSDPWSSRELNGPRLGERLGLSLELWAALDEPVLVLVRLVPEGPATRVDRITVRRPELGARIGGTVYWLGFPTLEESYAWFRDIYATVRSPDVRETVVEVIGIHPLPEARTFMERVLASDADGPVRGEAAEGLGRQQPDTAVARLLFNVAMTDPDGGVRRQATEALARVEPRLAVELLVRLAGESGDEDVQQQAAESLARVGTPAAIAALEELVDNGRSEDVRREALDQLAERGGGVSGDALLRMALSDDDPDLRRDAVERIGELPPDRAVPLLRRVVFESGDGTAERQAAETLGDIGTEPAFRLLREILQRNPSEDASFQAVEAVAEGFPRALARPLLRDVLDSHPSSRVRREALDRLTDLGG